MAKSAEAQAPQLEGFTVVAHLGGGGFADVFLYRQHLPDRQVAVKVLRSTVDDAEALRAFNAEANLMAKVSTHPHIVTIHGAGVSTDRRPYLVMEYYPSLHFGDRIKQGPMRVDKVLEVGIKVSAAIETAHRAHIVHRDIKPANILVSEFEEPGLTDFGISATQTDSSPEESLGFSPPYAPPEIVSDEHPGDERSDIFSLGATMWAMLAGHSPFEHPGSDNSRAAIMRRVLAGDVPKLNRADVPAPLELALRQALSKDPNRRPQNAKSFALMLQGVEHDLGYQLTPINLADTQARSAPIAVPIGAPTQVGRGKVVSPDGPTGPRMAPPASLTTDASATGPSTWVRNPVGQASVEPDTFVVPRARAESTSVPSPVPAGVSAAIPAEERPRWQWIAAAAVVLAIVGAIAAVALTGGGTDARPGGDTAPTVFDGPVLGGVAELQPVSNLAYERVGDVVRFTWTHSGGDGVQYQVTRVDDPAAVPESVSVTEYVLSAVAANVTPCVTVVAFVPGQAFAAASPAVCAT